MPFWCGAAVFLRFETNISRQGTRICSTLSQYHDLVQLCSNHDVRDLQRIRRPVSVELGGWEHGEVMLGISESWSQKNAAEDELDLLVSCQGKKTKQNKCPRSYLPNQSSKVIQESATQKTNKQALCTTTHRLKFINWLISSVLLAFGLPHQTHQHRAWQRYAQQSMHRSDMDVLKLEIPPKIQESTSQLGYTILRAHPWHGCVSYSTQVIWRVSGITSSYFPNSSFRGLYKFDIFTNEMTVEKRGSVWN